QMAKNGTFTYGGRGDAPNALFTSGKCGMFTGSSGARANIERNAKFKFGTAFLPHHDDIDGAPQNTIIGGASLWVFAKKSPETYRGVTNSSKYISRPALAARWHQQTGYVPVTQAGYEVTKKAGFYDKNPGSDIAVRQLDADTTDNSRGVRLGFLPQIREVADGEMERIFSGEIQAEAGLKRVAERGNELLQRFESSVK